MKNRAFVICGLLAAAFTATIAFGQWSEPLALAPVKVDECKNVNIVFEKDGKRVTTKSK